MTGPAVPSDEDLQEAVAEAIREHGHGFADRGDGHQVAFPLGPAALAAALLPVVRRYADQRAAEELRAAAVGRPVWTHSGRRCIPVADLTARADALTREATT